MTFTPSNRVYLLDTPLDNTYANEIHFSSRTAQQAYFKRCEVKYIEDVDYIRKDNKIVIEGNLDDHYNCNYVMYQNEDYNDRWFYAFITKMEWESERTYSIYIETDVYQTWMLDCELLQSFVVREHVKDDTIGKNLVEEGLDLGEYMQQDYKQTQLLQPLWFVIGLSDTVNSSDTVLRAVYSNVYSGIMYKAYSPTDDGLTTLINDYVTAGKGDAIQFIFTIPKILLPEGITSGSTIDSYAINTTEFTYKASFETLTGYKPINKKLYCYPYNFLYVSNNNGQSGVYRFEDFTDFKLDDTLTFAIIGSISPSTTAMLIPTKYGIHNAGSTDLNMEYALQLTGFPLCSWSNDAYKAWMAQNATQAGVTIVGGITAIGAGAYAGNLTGIAGGAGAILKEMIEIQKAGIQPDQSRGNVNGASTNIAFGMQDYFFSRKCLKYEYAKRIDNYFTMFGYKVNTLKIPEVSSRETWNYVKTIDVNITGHIPSDDMTRLKQIYNDGVTLWHSGDRLGNYNYSNNIV
jgi:hypothetical protein